MSRRARQRASVRAAKEVSLIAVDPEDDEDNEGSDPDTRIPIGPLDVAEPRDARWPFPTPFTGY